MADILFIYFERTMMRVLKIRLEYQEKSGRLFLNVGDERRGRNIDTNIMPKELGM